MTLETPEELQSRLLQYIALFPHQTPRELRVAMGYDKYNPHQPLKNPVHCALVMLRDRGIVIVHESSSGFGEPTFVINKKQATIR